MRFRAFLEGMGGDIRGFFNAIITQRFDTTARSAAADWLTENGFTGLGGMLSYTFHKPMDVNDRKIEDWDDYHTFLSEARKELAANGVTLHGDTRFSIGKKAYRVGIRGLQVASIRDLYSDQWSMLKPEKVDKMIRGSGTNGKGEARGAANSVALEVSAVFRTIQRENPRMQIDLAKLRRLKLKVDELAAAFPHLDEEDKKNFQNSLKQQYEHLLSRSRYREMVAARQPWADLLVTYLKAMA